METPNAPSERRSTLRPLRRKFKAASLGSSPVRPLNDQTPSSAPGVTYNKTAWHDPSRRSNAAPTPTLAKRRRQYFASITTFWKYHGHRGRGTITARPKHGLNRTRGCRFFTFLLLPGLYSSEGLFGSSIATQTMQGPGKQTSHAASRKSQVVSITSSIPVPHTILQLAPGMDMLTSPTFHLSHYLYRSALIAHLFNKQCIAFVYFCITFFFIYVP